MYSVIVNNQEVLQQTSNELHNTKSDLLQFTSFENDNRQAALLSDLQTNVESLIKTMDGYEKISDVPNKDFLLLSSVSSNGESISQISIDEEQTLSLVNSKSNEYHSKIKDFIALSKTPGFTQVKQNSINRALTLHDELNELYQKLTILNGDAANITSHTSKTVVEMAYLYLGIAASISAGCATAAALLVSKRVILGDLVRRTKIELVETTIRDLVGDGADLILHQLGREWSTREQKGENNNY